MVVYCFYIGLTLKIVVGISAGLISWLLDWASALSNDRAEAAFIAGI